jgi:Flp pilus assembly protein TadD
LLVGWVVVGVAWLLVRVAAVGQVVAYPPSDVLKALWANLPTLVPYFGRSLLPFQSGAWQLLRDARMIDGVIAILSVVLLTVWFKGIRLRFLLFGALWMVVFLAPTFIRPVAGGVYLSEQRLYVPLIGVILMGCELASVQPARISRRLAPVLGAGWLLLFAALSLVQARRFADRIPFWEHAAATSPSSAANRTNLGVMYLLEGRQGQAEAEFKQALALNPREPFVHGNLATIYLQRGLVTEAEEAYRKELEVNPRPASVYANLGNLSHLQGDVQQAERLWLQALRLDPSLAHVHHILATYYAEQGRLDEARAHAEAIEQLGVPIPDDLARRLEVLRARLAGQR